MRTYIQNSFGISRRKFVSLVDEGKVFVDGNKISSYNEEAKNGNMIEIVGILASTKVDVISYQKKLLVFNKPVGVIVSKSNDQGKNIYDILPDEYANRYYIGRLDKDSCGLLLLTNDSGLVNTYSHPSNKIEKEYEVVVDKKLSNDEVQKSLAGIIDEEEKLSFKKNQFKGNYNGMGNRFIYRVYLEEGKNRHIRRVFKYFGIKIYILKRLREGNIVLGDLADGKYKEIDVL